MKIPVISILIMILVSACVNDADEPIRSLSAGDQCPYFNVTLNDSSLFSPSMFRGKGGMIVLFNTSCADCRKELPVVDTAFRLLNDTSSPDYISGGFSIIAISRAEENASIISFWNENSLILPYAACPDRSIYDLFASSVIPRIYAIGPDLKIARVWTDNPLPSASDLIGIATSISRMSLKE